MDSAFEAALQAAFARCEAAGLPLDPQQQQILLSAFLTPADSNPLDQLTPDQRSTLLAFVREQEQQGRPWKTQLLNDWLQGQSSGEMQFVRDQYGLQWLDRIQTHHLAAYAEETLTLKVGDRIEVSNSLWEWVQEDGPCQREWITCRVVSVSAACDTAASIPTSYQCYTTCTIRFENGSEYEIQGVYEWNRYNWRWSGANQA
ncbi:hypothetical protein H6F67_24925 [Microcoleus sp. FACHB-1515]|uniref:hypothetical protein n=1 Tax=Cyanophyceae TaxID=3028117 RepID=UPI001682AEA9|nr:hypothetical protein [Microcoleus sp. FACHB-1515]MBD2093094.1 hypothetical protein [Microcoleus sp. FACHB-1515]